MVPVPWSIDMIGMVQPSFYGRWIMAHLTFTLGTKFPPRRPNFKDQEGVSWLKKT